MKKKMEFVEGEEQEQRVNAVMRALVSPKPSKKMEQLPQTDAKPVRERLDRP